MAFFSRTTQVSQHQNGKPVRILLKQEMMGWHRHQLDHMQIIKPRPSQITTPVPHHSVFTGQMPFLLPNQQHQSTEGWSKYLSIGVYMFQTDVYTLGRVYLQLCAALHLTIPLLGETFTPLSLCLLAHVSVFLLICWLLSFDLYNWLDELMCAVCWTLSRSSSEIEIVGRSSLILKMHHFGHW